MAVSRISYQLFPLTAAIFFLSLTSLPLVSGGMNEEEVKKMMVLGSKPPACVNKCMSCTPCQATLVIPPHNIHTVSALVKSSHESEKDTYYLLSWKCACGNNLYHP